MDGRNREERQVCQVITLIVHQRRRRGESDRIDDMVREQFKRQPRAISVRRDSRGVIKLGKKVLMVTYKATVDGGHYIRWMHVIRSSACEWVEVQHLSGGMPHVWLLRAFEKLSTTGGRDL